MHADRPRARHRRADGGPDGARLGRSDRGGGPGRDGRLPEGTLSIDAGGRTLLPGLVDSHVHARSADLARYVDEGITTVRNLWGFAGLLEGAAALVRDGAVAPTIESASPGVDGPGSPWPQTQLITDPQAADALVSRLKGEGWRWLKVYSHLDARVFDAVADAADAHGIRFLGHVPFTVPLQHALDRRMLSIEHLTGYELALGGQGSTPTRPLGLDVRSRRCRRWPRRRRPPGPGTVRP